MPTGITWDERTEELVSDGTQTSESYWNVNVKLVSNTFEVEQTIIVNIYLNNIRAENKNISFGKDSQGPVEVEIEYTSEKTINPNVSILNKTERTVGLMKT